MSSINQELQVLLEKNARKEQLIISLITRHSKSGVPTQRNGRLKEQNHCDIDTLTEAQITYCYLNGSPYCFDLDRS